MSWVQASTKTPQKRPPGLLRSQISANVRPLLFHAVYFVPDKIVPSHILFLPNHYAHFTLWFRDGWVSTSPAISPITKSSPCSGNRMINPPSQEAFSTFRMLAEAVSGTPAVSSVQFFLTVLYINLNRYDQPAIAHACPVRVRRCSRDRPVLRTGIQHGLRSARHDDRLRDLHTRRRLSE